MEQATPNNVKVGTWLRASDESRKYDGVDGLWLVKKFTWYGDQESGNEIILQAFYDWESQEWDLEGWENDVIEDMGLKSREFTWDEGMYMFVVYDSDQEMIKDFFEREFI